MLRIITPPPEALESSGNRNEGPAESVPENPLDSVQDSGSRNGPARKLQDGLASQVFRPKEDPNVDNADLNVGIHLIVSRDGRRGPRQRCAGPGGNQHGTTMPE